MEFNPLGFLQDIFLNLRLMIEFGLESIGVGPMLIDFIVNLLGVSVVLGFLLTNALLIIWMERKIVSRVQDRFGPNRVGPWGILQGLPDGIKMITKEIIFPRGIDIVPFMLAPIISAVSVFLIWAVMPFTLSAIGTDISIGVLYIVAVGSFGVMAVLMAGWSSNNKYALLGAFRAVAMLVSYEVPVILMLLVPVLLAGSMRIGDIVAAQPIWFGISMPVALIIFMIGMTAEIGRSPFDFLEAESELVSGYNTEYSGMPFAMFYLAEFLHAFTFGALVTTLFLGGWRLFGAEAVPTLGIFFFFAKTFAVYFLSMWVRYTVPRLRIDQAMAFCWKFLTPIGLLLLILTVFVDKLAAVLLVDFGVLQEGAYYLTDNIIVMLPRSFVLLTVNVIVGLVAFVLIANNSRRERERLESLNNMAEIQSDALTGVPVASFNASGAD